jgi:4-carboxymuconolactone decarboxylase
MLRLPVAFALFCALLASGSAAAEQRLPTIPPDQYTADQKKAAEEFLAARKVPVFGPFEPLMHSPEVMSLARSMGDYLRYHSSVGNTLSELIVLVTAREWSQDCGTCIIQSRSRPESPKALQMRSPMGAGLQG